MAVFIAVGYAGGHMGYTQHSGRLSPCLPHGPDERGPATPGGCRHSRHRTAGLCPGETARHRARAAAARPSNTAHRRRALPGSHRTGRLDPRCAPQARRRRRRPHRWHSRPPCAPRDHPRSSRVLAILFPQLGPGQHIESGVDRHLEILVDAGAIVVGRQHLVRVLLPALDHALQGLDRRPQVNGLQEAEQEGPRRAAKAEG